MSDTSLIDAIRILAGTYKMIFASMVVCSVKSVDLPTRTCICSPLSGANSSDLTNVQLMAEVEDGLLLIPAIDSTVIVCYSIRNAPYIALFSAVQKVILVSVDGIQFQGGEFGGLVISSNLVERLNIIEDTINELIAKTNILAPTPVIPVIIDTVESEITNPAITHGS